MQCEWESITGIKCEEDAITQTGFLTIGPHYVTLDDRSIPLCTKHFVEYQEDHK